MDQKATISGALSAFVKQLRARDVETVAPYRLSGVLRRGRDDDWRFALFNGSEPTVPT
jgi:hypothetical protein